MWWVCSDDRADSFVAGGFVHVLDGRGDRSMSSSLSPSQLHTVNMRDPLNRVLANLFLLFSSILGSKTAGPHTQFVQSFIEECVECLEQGSRGSILQFMPFTMVSYELGGEGARKISQKETDG
ncbi:Mediator of RNA polymerase II transcription subunit 24 [Ilyodon furcidens]|uniref:Mediator of RNA polymerase II transcription subunit 24 n=1 Tax=Ilyodon furcidens TaxID=33524 RepID=A0ABV0V5M3_9TELE